MSDKLPLVSICIPAYNSEKWIKETLQSAINQTWTNKEIIVVDDGSTDSTLNILAGFRCDLIKIVAQKNKGACAARNLALSLSSGDYIQWLDADDLLAPDKIEVQLKEVNYAKDTNILLSSSFAKFYNNYSNAKFIHSSIWQDLTPEEWLLRHLRDGNIMYPHAWLVSKSITTSAGKWDENILLNQDGEYFARVVASSKYVKFVEKAKCYYRTGYLTSLSSTKSLRKINSLIDANLLCVDHLLNLNNNNTTRNASILFLQNLYAKLYYDDNELKSVKSLKQKIIELGGNIPKKKESLKFHFLRSLLGLKLARKFKSKLWSLEMIIRRSVDEIINK